MPYTISICKFKLNDGLHIISRLLYRLSPICSFMLNLSRGSRKKTIGLVRGKHPSKINKIIIIIKYINGLCTLDHINTVFYALMCKPFLAENGIACSSTGKHVST